MKRLAASDGVASIQHMAHGPAKLPQRKPPVDPLHHAHALVQKPQDVLEQLRRPSSRQRTTDQVHCVDNAIGTAKPLETPLFEGLKTLNIWHDLIVCFGTSHF